MYLVYSLPERRSNVEQCAMSKAHRCNTPQCQRSKNFTTPVKWLCRHISKQDTINLIFEFVCCFVCTVLVTSRTISIVSILENGAVLSIAEATESHPWAMLSVLQHLTIFMRAGLLVNP